MNSLFSRFITRILILALLSPLVYASDRSKELPPRYRHWLNEEVNYIIDRNERKQFLSLTTDLERDSFITAFWKARNSDPGSETNSYKDEFYARLAYANEHFGSIGLQNGSHTDQGRIYIMLGRRNKSSPTRLHEMCARWRSGFTRAQALRCRRSST